MPISNDKWKFGSVPDDEFRIPHTIPNIFVPKANLNDKGVPVNSFISNEELVGRIFVRKSKQALTDKLAAKK